MNLWQRLTMTIWFKINRFKIFYSIWSLGETRYGYVYFSKKFLNDEPIDVFNFGNMERDFIYIDDIVRGIISAIANNYEF